MARGLQSAGRTGPLAALAIAVLILTPAAAAQQTIDYDALVDQYARGDVNDAVRALARWPQPLVSRSVADRAPAFSAGHLRAAVMLHTDLAYALMMAGNSTLARSQVGLAQRLFGTMHPRRGDAAAQRFERRWFAFVASMYSAHGLVDDADFLLRGAITAYPDDAMLRVAAGTVKEERVALGDLDPRRRAASAVRDRLLQQAAAEYRRAIAMDGTLAAAHLRLGWLRFRLGDDAGARSSVDTALEHAAATTDRYLAHLFLGAMAERARRFDEAGREYDAAQAIGPACQTPFVALARVEIARGRVARAQEIAAAWGALQNKVEDPWWDFNLGGFDADALAWLRTEAMRR